MCTATDKRCSLVSSNQKKFINSLLNREYRSITLDRIRKFNNQENEILITKEEQVKKEAAQHFSTQFRKRNHRFNTQLSTEWSQIYNSLPAVDYKWYGNITDISSERK